MLRRLHREQGAQGLAEFALMLPMFLILVFGVIDFGFGLKAYITVASASREASRYASIGNQGSTAGAWIACNSGSTNTVVSKACSTMGSLNQSRAQVKVECTPSCVSGNTVTVSSKYQYNYITPVRGLITVFTGGSLSSYLTISSSNTMRLE
ncbi:MAG TPA: TadE/TadG family type IV pilus assembly protein [Dehalococcoidia bacterium]|nr:TadE/TadG family type IV pilus assembly protein [Dehalococcoidia bacterium]